MQQYGSMADTNRIRFGLFDFDPATLELRRDGRPVKLQSQPARVLALLLAQPGETVTREAMREALWGDKTFVDFDRGLNFCIAQIRSALGDSADSPRFIKTLPKRGYQFIAPTSTPVPVALEIAPPKSTRRAWWLTVPALAAGAYFVPSRKAIRVAIARFDNLTGAPALDTFAEALADAVIGELTTSGGDRVAVIGNDPILRRSRTLRDVPAIGQKLEARYVLLGSVELNSAGVHVFIQLIRLPDQAHVAVARIPIDGGEHTHVAQRIVKTISPRLAA